MEAIYFYIQSKILIKESPPRNINEIFKIIDSNKLEIIGKNKFEKKFTRAEIQEHIQAIQRYSVAGKFKITGFLTVQHFERDVFIAENIKITNKKFEWIPTNLSFVTKNPSDKTRKTLTTEEKIRLVEEFHGINHRLPGNNEIFKDINIGKFVAKLNNESEMYQNLLKTLRIHK